MHIILTSSSLSRSELEAGLSLSRAFFPEAKAKTGELFIDNDSTAIIKVEVSYPSDPWKVEASFQASRQDTEISITLNEDRIKTILLHNKIGSETENKLLLKHSLYTLLSKVTGHTPPWGILTGIRPSKILHRLNDFGTPKELTDDILKERYAIRKDKIKLLQDIMEIQSPYLKVLKNHPEQVAVYVGIPFCPTRCTYCSFPAYSLQRGREPLEAYLKGLYGEIRLTGEWMRETGRVADSLYIGGGTPTVLTTREISELLQFIKQNIPMLKDNHALNGNEGFELSVEAGRPDTLSKEKLKALHELGVNRLSINPQTMHNRTLERIGRAHTVKDILRVYEYARELSDWIINMDLILGLPGEEIEDITESLRRIGELKPDNLTVHALAIKRGSKEHELGLKQNLSKDLEAMQERVLSSASDFGLYPYYLYRQKHIAGNLENIGFARPGKECRYNIGIMEERQSVIGIGAGASSKVVDNRDYSLVNLLHPSNWQVYLERWKEDFLERAERFEQISK